MWMFSLLPSPTHSCLLQSTKPTEESVTILNRTIPKKDTEQQPPLQNTTEYIGSATEEEEEQQLQEPEQESTTYGDELVQNPSHFDLKCTNFYLLFCFCYNFISGYLNDKRVLLEPGHLRVKGMLLLIPLFF